MTVEYTHRARTSLKAIFEYIAAEDADAANRLVMKLSTASITLLERIPKQGGQAAW
jgi:plasmid stabilization system protein ParE